MLSSRTVHASSAERRSSRAGPTRPIAASISASAGGTICAPSPAVDLVAVVLRRVVRGGDHHARRPRRGAAPRTRAPAWAAAGASAARRSPAAAKIAAESRANSSDPCRASKPTTTGGPRRLLACSQAAKPGRGPAHTARFMPLGPAPQRPAQAGGAERRAVRRTGRPARRRASPASSPSQQFSQLVGGQRVDVVGDPGLHLGRTSSTAHAGSTTSSPCVHDRLATSSMPNPRRGEPAADVASAG